MKRETLVNAVLAILVIAVIIIGVKAFSQAPSGAPAVQVQGNAAAQPATSGQPTPILEKVAKTGQLDVCYAELPPTVVKDPSTGEMSGILVDMAQFMAQAMGNVKLAWHQTTWGTFPADLNSYRCDLVVAETFITIPRATAVAYSSTIAYTGNSAIVRKGSGLENTASIDDFDRENITIAVLNGEQGYEYTKQHFTKAKIRVVQGSDDTLPLMEVMTGRADVGLHESAVTAGFAAQHPEVVDVFARNPYNVVPIAWAMRSDDMAWLHFVDSSIEVMKTNGKLSELEAKYGITYWLAAPKNT